MHPVLTDVVIGTLLRVSLLDVLGGDDDRRARHRLILAGIAAATPTALIGVNDWAEEERADEGIRRDAARRSRRPGRRRVPRGHLSFVRGVGVDVVPVSPRDP